LRTVQTTFVVALLIPAALCALGCGGSAATIGKDVSAEQRGDAAADRRAADARGDATPDGWVPADSHSGTDSRADLKQDVTLDVKQDVKQDIKQDIKQDLGSDAVADAKTDVTLDVHKDAPPETGQETAPEAVVDVLGETEPETTPDAVDEQAEELPCIPDCTGKECGDDGCGGGCGQCDDGKVETTDTCVDSLCVFCLKDCYCKECGDDGCGGSCGSCDDGISCTADSCEGFKCLSVATDAPGCCQGAEDCDDGNPCTEHLCVANECVDNPVDDCCLDDSECQIFPAPCYDRWCEQSVNVCMWSLKSMSEQTKLGLQCCESDADCEPGGSWEEDGDLDGLPGPDNPGTVDYCNDYLCVHIASPADCQCGQPQAPACGESPEPCIQLVCHKGCACKPTWTEGCCVNDWDCNDFKVSTVDTCEDGTCTHVMKPTYSDCHDDYLCDDGNDCNKDICFSGDCYHIPYLEPPACCMDDSECQDPCACMDGYCWDHVCIMAPIVDCVPGS